MVLLGLVVLYLSNKTWPGSGFGQFEAQTGGNIGSSASSNSSNKGAVGMAPGLNPFADFDSLI